MKFKKYLKSLRQQARDSLIDADSAFVDSVRDRLPEIEPLPERSVDARPIIIVAAMILTVAIAFVLIFCLPHPTSKIEYLSGNEEKIISNCEELNNNLNYFCIASEEINNFKTITKYYDTKTNDNLYFRATYNEDNLRNIEFVFVVNKNYEYKDFEFTKEVEESTLHGFAIKYSFTETKQGGLNKLNAIAEINAGEQTVYITKYEEYYLAEDGFFDTLNSILQPKTV